MSLEVGAIVEGEVTGITNFGAFVQLPEGKVGLIHISEVSNVYVKDVHDFLKEHDKVKVKVLSVDDRGKIGLSIKQLTPPPANQQPRPQRPQNDTASAAATTVCVRKATIVNAVAVCARKAQDLWLPFLLRINYLNS